MLDRRRFFKSCGIIGAVVTTSVRRARGALPRSLAFAKEVIPKGDILPAWCEGNLEIHHISTGRGNATFFIFPDGTTLLVDAGAIAEDSIYTIAPLPDARKRPGEWIAEYIARSLPQDSRGIDYAVLTHFHGDHIGAIGPDTPLDGAGYFVTGISDVDRRVPISVLFDRGYPTYRYPQAANTDDWKNYQRYVDARVRSGRKVDRIEVGDRDQIRLLHAPKCAFDFEVLPLAANGIVWNAQRGVGLETFPPIDSFGPNELVPSENMCSVALRLRYGAFTYYTGGDLTTDIGYPAQPWRDIETRVAEACGPVAVAVANHHGYIDSCGPQHVDALRPKAFVVFAWDSAHPTVRALNDMLTRSSPDIPRQVFATAMKPENRIANRKTAQLKTQQGHVVLRVLPGGELCEIYIADSTQSGAPSRKIGSLDLVG